jgi:hypothetical protein
MRIQLISSKRNHDNAATQRALMGFNHFVELRHLPLEAPSKTCDAIVVDMRKGILAHEIETIRNAYPDMPLVVLADDIVPSGDQIVSLRIAAVLRAPIDWRSVDAAIRQCVGELGSAPPPSFDGRISRAARETCEDIVRWTREWLGADSCALIELEPDGTPDVLAVSETGGALGDRRWCGPGLLWERCAREGVVHYADGASRALPELASFEAEGCIAVAVHDTQGRPSAMLVALCQGWLAMPPNGERTLVTVAARAARAVEQGTAERVLTQARHDAEALMRNTSGIIVDARRTPREIIQTHETLPAPSGPAMPPVVSGRVPAESQTDPIEGGPDDDVDAAEGDTPRRRR